MKGFTYLCPMRKRYFRFLLAMFKEAIIFDRWRYVKFLRIFKSEFVCVIIINRWTYNKVTVYYYDLVNKKFVKKVNYRPIYHKKLFRKIHGEVELILKKNGKLQEVLDAEFRTYPKKHNRVKRPFIFPD